MELLFLALLLFLMVVLPLLLTFMLFYVLCQSENHEVNRICKAYDELGRKLDEYYESRRCKHDD